MLFAREYHSVVRHSISASVALFSLIALIFFAVPNTHAQINGVPSSVTSPGFGGRAVNGAPPSVTSVGPRGFVPNPSISSSTRNGFHNGDGRHHHHHFVPYTPPFVYAPYPYSIDIGAAEDGSDNSDYSATDDDANYQGGPTIFDRRGSGRDSYVPPVRDVRSRPAAQGNITDPPADLATDTPTQEPTLLVFKDGRKLEVGNYAIVGATLFDLTPGHPRKIALADLDLEATTKQNEDRGIIFRLPLTSQAD